jgi:hypothetical protein
MARDIVAHGGEFGVHQLFGARHHLVAFSVGRGQFADPSRNVERLLERVHFLQDITGGFAFGRCFLRGAQAGKRGIEDEEFEWLHVLC